MYSVTLDRLFHHRKFRKILAIAVFIAVVLSQMIVPIERQAGGTIQTPFDGVWWGVTTITTVGYGDYVPITTVGKIIGMALQLTGTLMFGITLATISLTLNRTQDEYQWRRNWERLDRIESILNDINKQSSFLVKDKHHDAG